MLRRILKVTRTMTILSSLTAVILAPGWPASGSNQSHVMTGYGKITSRNGSDYAGGYSFCQGMTAGEACTGFTHLKPTRIVRVAAKTPERYVRVTGTITNGVAELRTVHPLKKADELRFGNIAEFNVSPPCAIYDPAYKRIAAKPSTIGPLTMTSTIDNRSVVSSGDPSVKADCNYSPGTAAQGLALQETLADALFGSPGRLVIAFTDPKSRITYLHVTYVDDDLVQRVRKIAGDLPVSIVPWIETT